VAIFQRFLPRPSRIDLDLVEKVVVSLFLAALAARLIPAISPEDFYLPLLLLGSEGLVVLFILLRRRTEAISRRTSDWLVGFAGTLLPLLAIPGSGDAIVPRALCGLLMAGGFCLHLSAKLTLRRSFGVVAANRGVKAGGPYRLVRHPMYAGYALTHVGFLLSGPTGWNLAIYGLTLALAVTRILAEERLLRRDPAYCALAAKVRYRLVPLLF
jgi:protein-S-isoprenylcysteine O-methyltransferase Ste14